MGRYSDQSYALSSSRADDTAEDIDLTMRVDFTDIVEMYKAYYFLSRLSCTIKRKRACSFDVPAEKELSNREREVLTLFGKGCSYAEVAACLDCKVSTIQTHVKNIYKKMEVHSRAEAVHEALQLGLIAL